MKKIHTLTTQYANNQGALLQCYALCEYLNSLDNVQCEVLDYNPLTYNRSWVLFPKPRNFRAFVKNIYTAFQLKYLFNKKKKNASVKSFIRDYIRLTEASYNRSSIIQNPPVVDAFICGSDQIWNYDIHDFRDPTYYLDFVDKVPSARRISYAASIADPWKPEALQMITPLLKKFDAISIREKGNMPDVARIVGPNVSKWVCDPVFLLSKDQWDKIARVPDEKKPYILCYFLNIDPESAIFIDRLRKLTGYKVINLVLSSREKFKSDKLIYVYNPRDFVGYIKNATYIVTNSFHCSAFSSIYRKNFKFIPKHWANERLLSLEELFGYNVIMDKKHCVDFTEDIMQVDYSDMSKMEKFIEQSKEFLKNAIGE